MFWRRDESLVGAAKRNLDRTDRSAVAIPTAVKAEEEALLVIVIPVISVFSSIFFVLEVPFIYGVNGHPAFPAPNFVIHPSQINAYIEHNLACEVAVFLSESRNFMQCVEPVGTLPCS